MPEHDWVEPEVLIDAVTARLIAEGAFCSRGPCCLGDKHAGECTM